MDHIPELLQILLTPYRFLETETGRIEIINGWAKSLQQNSSGKTNVAGYEVPRQSELSRTNCLQMQVLRVYRSSLKPLRSFEVEDRIDRERTVPSSDRAHSGCPSTIQHLFLENRLSKPLSKLTISWLWTRNDSSSQAHQSIGSAVTASQNTNIASSLRSSFFKVTP